MTAVKYALPARLQSREYGPYILGLDVVALGEKRLVRDVLWGSPADQAGIRTGDQVLDVKGTPLEELSDNSLISSQTRNAVELVVLSGNETRTLRLSPIGVSQFLRQVPARPPSAGAEAKSSAGTL
jgi:predicted metalloprotease with PDZ domain